MTYSKEFLALVPGETKVLRDWKLQQVSHERIAELRRDEEERKLFQSRPLEWCASVGIETRVNHRTLECTFSKDGESITLTDYTANAMGPESFMALLQQRFSIGRQAADDAERVVGGIVGGGEGGHG